MFKENISKSGLKHRREKLKANRFKAIQHEKNSVAESVLVKRFAKNLENKEAKG